MSSSTHARIVLIEDNQADVFLIEQALQDRGLDFELVHYATGDEALEHCCPGPELPLVPPDIILLDLHMPGTEGPEILRLLRNEPRLMDVPVAIISGADPARLKRTDLTGSTRVIRKSMELDTYQGDVGDAVKEMLVLRRASVLRGTEPAVPGNSVVPAGSKKEAGRALGGAKKKEKSSRREPGTAGLRG
jgi:CheY-like chemotaxis protein